MAQKKKVLNILRFLLLAALAGFIGFNIGKMGRPADVGADTAQRLSAGAKIALIALFVPIVMFVIGWHEGGHAWAGVRMGFDFRLYVVGPFMWEKENGQWRFKWNKNVNTAGGMVLCLPTDTRDLRRRFAMYAAAGPLSSLLLAGLAYGLYLILKHNGVIESRSLPGLFLHVTALLSVAIFVATAIPMRMGGFYSDGARVMRLLRSGEVAQFEVFMLKMIAQSMGGVRPKLLDVAEIQAMLDVATRLKEPFAVYLHGYLHQAALDQGDLDSAEKHLLDYIGEIENIPAGIREAVWLDAAFFYAHARKDRAKAEEYWQRFQPSAIIPKAQIFATEAAMASLRNDPVTMHAKAQSALLELPNMLDQGIATALKDKLAQYAA